MNMYRMIGPLCLVLLGHVGVNAKEHVFNHEHVLGTSCELRVSTDSPRLTTEFENAALEEIDRLAAIFSAHDSDSEFAKWRRGVPGTWQKVSGDLMQVLRRAEYWRNKTDGAFDSRVESLSNLWRQAVHQQRTPSARDRLVVCKQLLTAAVEFQRTRVRRTSTLPMSLDGLAKGFILDRVSETLAAEFPAIDGFTIDIGGDLRKVGNRPGRILIVNPFDDSEGARMAGCLEVDFSVSMATSGSYRRGFSLPQQRYSHLIDPRNGLPVEHVVSATVIAANAMDADALATSVAVLGRRAGLALIEECDAECLLIEADGDVFTSSGWPTPANKDDAQPLLVSVAAEQKAGLIVDFSLNRSKKGRYRRPYVAVWLEDADGFPVKTGLLWLQTDQPGPRWHRDLTRWYRNDRTRKLVEKTDLIGTVAAATRGPGAYQARFDGTDNDGKLLPDGRYTLCLEVAREHGTYQIIRERFEFQRDTAIGKKTLKDNTEVSDVHYEYVPLKVD